jgi:cellulose synthase/poly-beta-1,6-N-acetylglucosamine synthase-like glycosyltransferase
MTSLPMRRIAVLIPCYNEAATIAATVQAFRASLPQAQVYVFDNNSQDDTAGIARAPARWCATYRNRARAVWCGACLPMSKPMPM